MKKILVIDDDRLTRLMLRMVLEDEGYFIEEASNGKEGIRYFSQNQIDLVITDLVMPEKEGIETIRELKEISPDVNIIAISGGGRVGPEGYLPVAKSMGAKYVFKKPVDTEKLIEAIRTLLT